MSAGDAERLDLDFDYSPSKWTKRMNQNEIAGHYVQVCSEESEKVRRGNIERELDLEYGPSEREKVDIYFPTDVQKDAPVLIFIHGGYWQIEAQSKDNNAIVVPSLVKHRAIVAVTGYSLAPKVTVPAMVKQVQQAVLFIARRFPESRGIYICGHSAGGHLAAMMLSFDWSSQPDISRNIIKGVFPISGLFDLRPIVKTGINGLLSLTESTAASISPMLLVDQIPECNSKIFVRLTAAENDPPVFREQMDAYCKLLSDQGMDAKAEVIPGKDHFDEILAMVNEDDFQQQVILQMMNLTL